jgi:hypothetical protein
MVRHWTDVRNTPQASSAWRGEAPFVPGHPIQREATLLSRTAVRRPKGMEPPVKLDVIELKASYLMLGFSETMPSGAPNGAWPSHPTRGDTTIPYGGEAAQGDGTAGEAWRHWARGFVPHGGLLEDDVEWHPKKRNNLFVLVAISTEVLSHIGKLALPMMYGRWQVYLTCENLEPVFLPTDTTNCNLIVKTYIHIYGYLTRNLMWCCNILFSLFVFCFLLPPFVFYWIWFSTTRKGTERVFDCHLILSWGSCLFSLS